VIGYEEGRATLRVHNCNDRLGRDLPLSHGEGASSRPSALPEPLPINLQGARRGRAGTCYVVPRVPLQKIVSGLVRDGLFSAGDPPLNGA